MGLKTHDYWLNDLSIAELFLIHAIQHISRNILTASVTGTLDAIKVLSDARSEAHRKY